MKKLLLLSAFTAFLLNSCGGADQNAASNIALVEGYVNAVQELDSQLILGPWFLNQ